MTKKHSWILSAMLVSSFWSGTVMAAPAANPAGDGPGVAIGTGSSAARDTSVAVGKNAKTMDSNGEANGGGDVAIGSNARVNNYVNQGGSVAMGENSFAENMAGRQEKLFNFNQTTFTGSGFLGLRSPFIPADPSKVTGSIALGQNSYARSGGTVIGVHNYKGALGDMTIDTSTEANRRSYGINVNATTIGTNSFNNAAFGVVNGAYSIISGAYDGSSYSSKAGQNFGATITGALNSIESKTAESDYSGVANSIVGTANRTFNSNGSLIFGAGNEITNSVTTIAAPSGGGNSAKELAETLRGIIRDADGGGATLAVGGGNKADYTRASQLIGVNNTLTGTAGSVSDYNMINGYKNTASQVSHVSVTGSENTVTNTKDAVVMGNKRDLSGASGSIVLGSADSTMTTGVTDAVSIGHNANVTEAGGVALGAQSKASTAAGVAGYDPSSRALSQDTSSTWNATAAAGTYVKADSTTGQNLTALDNQVKSNADSISHMSGSIDRLGTRVNRVGAGAAALAALHPLDFDPDSKWDFAAGYGNYKDAHAVAAGVYYRPNEDTMFSVGGSFGVGENMVNAGLSLKLGQGNHVSTSRVAMAKEIKDLRSDVENLRSAIASMAAGNALDPGKTKLFPDIPENHWAYDEIAQLYGNGIVKGYPDGRFDGDRMMTRYEFASLVYEQMQKGAALSNRVVTEFMPELERIRVDTVAKTRDGRPAIQRVRVIKDRG